ncbi:MAG: DeoR/GlpR family DNA-binding transcription regulator [Lachnospiraceae bacterium]|nr:DeoR/GlpR family DNA-binding transcription regulator [Lachnospiraceae bacterium]
MAKRNAKERQARILQLLADNGTMKMMELADYFQVSRETIRRDLIVLNQEGTAKKWFGGAVPVQNFDIPPIDFRSVEMQEEKRRIAEECLKHLSEKSVLFLDTGSTALCIARLLAACCGHTIITNSIPAVNTLLGSENQIIMTGGSVDSAVMSVTGMQTAEFLEHVKVDLAFLGSSGFDRHQGPTGNSFEDAQIKKIALRNARTTIVAADSRKADYSSLIQYAGWKDIDYLITDTGLSKSARNYLNELTQLICV